MEKEIKVLKENEDRIKIVFQYNAKNFKKIKNLASFGKMLDNP